MTVPSRDPNFGGSGRDWKLPITSNFPDSAIFQSLEELPRIGIFQFLEEISEYPNFQYLEELPGTGKFHFLARETISGNYQYLVNSISSLVICQSLAILPVPYFYHLLEALPDITFFQNLERLPISFMFLSGKYPIFVEFQKLELEVGMVEIYWKTDPVAELGSQFPEFRGSGSSFQMSKRVVNYQRLGWKKMVKEKQEQRSFRFLEAPLGAGNYWLRYQVLRIGPSVD